MFPEFGERQVVAALHRGTEQAVGHGPKLVLGTAQHGLLVGLVEQQRDDAEATRQHDGRNSEEPGLQAQALHPRPLACRPGRCALGRPRRVRGLPLA